MGQNGNVGDSVGDNGGDGVGDTGGDNGGDCLRETVADRIPTDTSAERLHTSLMGDMVSVLRGSTNSASTIIAWKQLVNRKILSMTSFCGERTKGVCVGGTGGA